MEPVDVLWLYCRAIGGAVRRWAGGGVPARAGTRSFGVVGKAGYHLCQWGSGPASSPPLGEPNLPTCL